MSHTEAETEVDSQSLLTEEDFQSLLADAVRAGRPIYIGGPMEDIQAKRHAATVNRLMHETNLPVTVIHTLE